MKKTASILLLALLAFNWIGYRLLTDILTHKADATLQSRIDRSDYDAASLIRITVPLNAPYLSGNSTAFEPYEGEIEINNVHYHYVKRRILDGNLVLLCLPNENKDRIQGAKRDFFKLVNDLGQPDQGKQKDNASVKSFTTEYSPEQNCWMITPVDPLIHQDPQTTLSFYASAYYRTVKQPPRA